MNESGIFVHRVVAKQFGQVARSRGRLVTHGVTIPPRQDDDLARRDRNGRSLVELEPAAALQHEVEFRRRVGVDPQSPRSAQLREAVDGAVDLDRAQHFGDGILRVVGQSLHRERSDKSFVRLTIASCPPVPQSARWCTTPRETKRRDANEWLPTPKVWCSVTSTPGRRTTSPPCGPCWTTGSTLRVRSTASTTPTRSSRPSRD